MIPRLKNILAAAAAVLACGALYSCSDDAPFIGSWTTAAPADITGRIAGSAVSTATTQLSFNESQQKGSGTVGMAYEIEVTYPLALPGVTGAVTIPGSASVDGMWTYDVDDRDDVLIRFDYKSLQVNIDSTRVRIVGVHPTRADSVLDGMFNRARDAMSGYVIGDMRRYTAVDDIEASADGSRLSFEIHSPAAGMVFVRDDH